MGTVLRRAVGTSVASLTAALVLTGCAGFGEAPEPTRLTAPPPGAPTLATTEAFSEIDAELVARMVGHHQEALDLAALVPDRTETPEVVVLAQDITDARTGQLAELVDRLDGWGVPTGTRSAEPATALAEAEGAEFDRLWLEEMTAHHEDGIALAEDVLGSASDRPTLTFAERLAETERAELGRLEAMRGG
ncbi:DUF305 domain-containing protein [Nostocoides sp. F2B08]|uniref:DUF305 domain-containing protein n=1 Tax=Nostocoides sp. F2B08 TaxID=2653936 RepID=UPI0012631A02|nr:DUF305 domain-containing protein [Tetrasphaera sp. F2B08]KAB7743593.1 DUF305 domain-containing protein [Tetrasphaera sp. F2B08]